MTYLQLVNSVLRRLREEEVEAVNQNSYSKLIGEFVSDAKRIVEDAWDWSSLRTTLTVVTTPNVFSYGLAGSGSALKELDVVNDTSNRFMKIATSRWMDNAFLNGEAPVGPPEYYSWNGFTEEGYAIVDMYPIPDTAYNIRFNVVNRTAAFTEDSQVLNVPSSPVIQLATALGARERGETGGTSAAELFGLADRALSDAIALDAARHPEETIWTVV